MSIPQELKHPKIEKFANCVATFYVVRLFRFSVIRWRGLPMPKRETPSKNPKNTWDQPVWFIEWASVNRSFVVIELSRTSFAFVYFLLLFFFVVTFVLFSYRLDCSTWDTWKNTAKHVRLRTENEQKCFENFWVNRNRNIKNTRDVQDATVNTRWKTQDVKRT